MEPSDSYLSDFQAEVGEWSRENFGEQHEWVPLMYVVEEYLELQGASDIEEIIDSVGDIMVSLADFCERRGYQLSLCASHDPWHPQEHDDWQRWTGEHIETLVRSVVKIHQGIRLDEDRVGETAERRAIAGIVFALALYCNDRGFELDDAIESAWYDEVQHREWNAA